MKIKYILVVIIIVCSYAQVAFAGMWSQFAKDITKSVVIGVTKRVITNIIVDAITQPSSASAKEMPSIVQSSANDNDRIKNIAIRHFRSESQCDINGIMPFYNDIVYYENKDVNSDYIKKTKEAVCQNSKDASFTIKDNAVTVGDFDKDNSIKIIEYDVDFDVYSIKKQQRTVGTSRVRLAIRNDKIIGEFHKRLSSNEKVPQQKDTIQPVPTVQKVEHSVTATTPSMVEHDVVPLLKQMLTLAKNNGGLGQETQIEALKRQIETFPNPARGDRKSARLQNDKGLEAVKNERFDQALQYFLTAYQLDPGDVEIVNNVGFAALKAGNLPDAATYLGKALSMAPSRASAWSDLANVYARSGRIEDAVAAYALMYRFSKNKDNTRRFLEQQAAGADHPQVMEPAKQALALPLIRGGLAIATTNKIGSLLD